MRRILSGAAIAMMAVSVPAAAQGRDQPVTQCLDLPAQAEDACQKAVDLFDYMMPQLGTAMAGGNPTLGQGGTLGGFPRFQIGIRVSAVKGSLPQFDDTNDPTTAGYQRSSYETDDIPVPMPAVDLSVGILGGIPLPFFSLGGLDLLLSAAYVPSIDEDDISLDVDSPVRLGYGARLGLIQESAALPSVTFLYLQRGLPEMDLTAVIEDGQYSDTIFVRDFDVSTQSWRLIVSKKLTLITLAVGGGQDAYDASTNLSAIVNEGPPTCPIDCRAAFGADAGGQPLSFDQEVVRTSYFANLKIAFFAAEIGQVSGGDIKTYNTYATEPDASRLYASVGVRFGF